VPRLVRATTASEAAGDGTWEPRHDLVSEVADGPGRFVAAAGPFTRYERTVRTGADGMVTDVVDYRLAPAVGLVPYGILFRRALRKPPRDGSPWWAPPEVLDARAATSLASLCGLAVVVGYLGTLLTQTITFAAGEFGASTGDQSAVLAAVRISVFATIALTALADRRGRRKVLLVGTAVACVVSALGGFAPDLVTLGLSQVVVRALVTSCTVLLTVIVVEEMPAGARAFGISLLGLCGALGVGMCLWALPLADLSAGAWRALWFLALLGLPMVAWMGRHLPESRRFEAQHDVVPMAGHGQRLALLAASAFLLALFATPASQLMNQFLREERGFSASRISLFSLLTNTPGFIGVVVGARLADRRGRRIVGAVAVSGGVVLTAAMVLAAGWPMWALSVVGAIVGAAAVPALGVYGPELFPTSLRGRANGLISVFGVSGTVVGLLTAGYLSDRWGGLGKPLLLLSLGPLVMAVLVLVAYPETVHQALEDINPEDPSLEVSAAASPAHGPRS
jgi:putative MFS transporter